MLGQNDADRRRGGGGPLSAGRGDDDVTVRRMMRYVRVTWGFLSAGEPARKNRRPRLARLAKEIRRTPGGGDVIDLIRDGANSDTSRLASRLGRSIRYGYRDIDFSGGHRMRASTHGVISAMGCRNATRRSRCTLKMQQARQLPHKAATLRIAAGRHAERVRVCRFELDE